MRHILIFSILALILTAGAGCSRSASAPSLKAPNAPVSNAGLVPPVTTSTPAAKTTSTTFELQSPTLRNGEAIAARYTCDGENVNPPFTLLRTPKGTRSLGILVLDRDANTFLHWAVWNIPADTRFIQEKIAPPGAVEGKNGRGTTGYTGPCPPDGSHRYQFTAFAFNEPLAINNDAAPNDIIHNMTSHAIASSTIDVTYANPGR